MNQIKRSYLCASFSTLTLWSWLPGSEEVRCHSCCSVLMANVPAGNFVNMCLKLHFKTSFVSATNGKITCFVRGINVTSYQSAMDILVVHSLSDQNIFKVVSPPCCCSLIYRITSKEYFHFIHNFIFTI